MGQIYVGDPGQFCIGANTGSAALISIVSTGLSPLAASAQTVEEGRSLAERHCARCHAIGLDDGSAFAPAPAFREIAQRYSVWMLQEALAEGIVVGHDAMPKFVFAPSEIGRLLSYMEMIGKSQSFDQ